MANYTVYNDRPLDQARDYAERILYGYHGDYIFFRESLTDSYLIWNGEIDGSTPQNITFTDCYVYKLSVMTDGTYQCLTSWNQSGTVSNSLERVVYGNQQYMPKLLDNGGELIGEATLISLSVLFFYLIFRDIFSSISRR